VARSGPLSLNRPHPYQRGYNSQVSYQGSYGGYQRGGYSGRMNTQQYNTLYAQSNQLQAQPLTVLNSTRLNQGSRQVQTGPANGPEQITDSAQYHPNIHYGKQCYACRGWNHISFNCWHAYPEYDPRNRAQWTSYGNYPYINYLQGSYPSMGQANITQEPSNSQAQSEQLKEHPPFEFNMVIIEEETTNNIGGTIHHYPTSEEDLNRRVAVFTESAENLVVFVELANYTMELKKKPVYKKRRWLIDSGTSSHYIKDLSKFRVYSWLDKPVKINTGKGPIYGIARGEVILHMQIGKVIIAEVLLVPDLDVKADLLSVTILMRASLGVNFEDGIAEIHKEKIIWGYAKPVDEWGGLCYIEEYEGVEEYELAMQCTDKQPFLIWHCRLGHVNRKTIRSMPEKVMRIEIGDRTTKPGERNIDCADCLRGSQHQIISRYPFSKVYRKLARISADIASPIRLPDITWGYKYLLVIIDHYSRYTWVFPLIMKDMAISALKVFKANAENQAGPGLNILTLQTDNGREFTGKAFVKWVQETGIEHITCAPYAPSMNSYVERAIKSIIGHVSAML